MKLGLAIAFFITALLYASVGFGGGSTYTALLAVTGTPYTLIPVVSLACNIAVVSGNSWRYSRAGLVRWRRLVPILALSIPAAWLGGRTSVSETLFIGMLWIALLIAGLRLIFAKKAEDQDVRATNKWVNSGLGAGIGFYSGLIGIGGGIFLAPILHGLRWGRAREIAAASSVFILVNSLAGLGGQLQKIESSDIQSDLLPYLPLLLSVIIGGWIGNRLSLNWLSPNMLRRLTGVLVLAVSIRLAIRWVGMI